MKKGKISVVVPVYNLQEYIEKTVDSIRKQTYENLEIILVDDGSKDGSPEILDNLAGQDDRIKVIHKKNGGVTSARICGIKAATGDWIGFVDGDDYIEPQMYEVLMSNAVKYQADISHCGYQMVFPSRVDYYYNTGKLVEQDNFTGVKDLLEGSFIEPGLVIKIFHRTLFDELLDSEFLDDSIKINEDLLMNYYLFRCSKRSVFVDKCYYHYILRKGSAATSQVNKNKLEDPLKVLEILEREVKDNQQLLSIVQNRVAAQLITLATMPFGNQKSLILPYKKEARKKLRARLPQILNGKLSIKRKLFTLWVLIFPWSYQLVHSLYARLTGIDKKFVVR